MLTFDGHHVYFEDALAKYDRCAFAEAVESWDCALEKRESAHARWNRGQARLSLGDYVAFAQDYPARWDLFPNLLNEDGEFLRAHLARWNGEACDNLVLVHEMGFGDSIMLLRYVPVLQRLGFTVSLSVPPELERLAGQLAPTVCEGAQYWTPMYDVLAYLDERPSTVPMEPYLKPDPELVEQWRGRVNRERRNIGIAWSTGRWQDRDFQRAIPLSTFLGLLEGYDAEIYSLQQQGAAEAVNCGVHAFAFKDFAEVAALASLMDEVVTVDTAAAHVAGAIGHGNVTVLLPYLSSWRWLGEKNVWYSVTRCQQDRPGDWASAFAKMKDRAGD